MRVLMVTQFYAPIIGGEERAVEDLSRALVRRGHDVAVATLHHGDLPKFEEADGVRMYRVSGAVQRISGLFSEKGRRHAPPAPDPGARRGLRWVIEREVPDLVHAHNWLVHSVVPLKAAIGIPLVLSVHDHSLICANKRLMRNGEPCGGPGPVRCLVCASRQYGLAKGTLTVAALRRSARPLRNTVDLFLPVSRFVAEHSGLVDDELPYEILPNFIADDTAETEQATSPSTDLPSDGFFLFVGDVTADKGARVLVEAYRGLDAPPLVLIGRRFSDTPADVGPGVHILKPRPHANVMDAWRRSSVAIVPSVCAEGFGLTALEAMSCGRPVIAARSGALPEIVTDGVTGLLTPPSDRSALRRAMARMATDDEMRTRMGEAARRHATALSEAAVVPRIEQIYTDVIDRSRSDGRVER